MIRPLLDHRRIGILTGASLCLWAACVPQDTPDVAASVALTLRREMEATLGPRTGIVRAAAG